MLRLLQAARYGGEGGENRSEKKEYEMVRLDRRQKGYWHGSPEALVESGSYIDGGLAEHH